jgi:hypothetical protein
MGSGFVPLTRKAPAPGTTTLETAAVSESGVSGAPVGLTEVLSTPCRICPVTGKGPLSIDCSMFEKLRSTTITKAGALRDKVQFWRHFREKYDTVFPEIWSETNLIKLKEGKAPIVDDAWLKYFPEHAKYVKDKIEHHHINHGNIAIPFPKTMHRTGLFDTMNHHLEKFIKEVAE